LHDGLGPRLAGLTLRLEVAQDTLEGDPRAASLFGDLSGLPAAVEVAAYRIATEALTNAVRHASASACEVRITRAADSVSVLVQDDGVGITAGNPRGLGVQSMRERAAELGGSFDARTPAGGGGRGSRRSCRCEQHMVEVEPIRVLIADDSADFRTGLRGLLEA
jgi:signal transduction histidine kinase